MTPKALFKLDFLPNKNVKENLWNIWFFFHHGWMMNIWFISREKCPNPSLKDLLYSLMMIYESCSLSNVLTFLLENFKVEWPITPLPSTFLLEDQIFENSKFSNQRFDNLFQKFVYGESDKSFPRSETSSKKYHYKNYLYITLLKDFFWGF